jgi:hypothetical protein
VFAREHNLSVDAFRKQAAAAPDDLFEVAGPAGSALIAKIDTTGWTPQLLNDEPLHPGRNGNWHGRRREHAHWALSMAASGWGR